MANKMGRKINMLDNNTTVYPLVMQYFVRKMPYHAENKQIILDMIAKVEISDATTSLDHDRFQQITKYDYMIVDKVANRPWVDFVTPKIWNVLNTMPSEIGWGIPDIRAMWFQQYLQTDHHQWHPHCGCNWAGIYFLEAPDSSCVTEFIEPFTQNRFRFNAQEGDIVLFPAQLVHRSSEFFSAHRKTVIAFNFDQMTSEMAKMRKEEEEEARKTN